jgi:hypothetical protein
MSGSLGEARESRYESYGPMKVLPPRNQRKVTRPKVQRKTPHETDSIDKELPSPLESKPSVGIIGAAALASAVRAGGQLFALSYQQMMELGGITTPDRTPTPVRPASCAVDMAAIEESILRYVPPEYHEFADVFSKAEASKLPPHREYDHHIPLQDDAMPPFGPLYRLSPVEEEVLRKYIQDNLTKKFIRHSQSPCSAAVLFVKKPDGSLRLCVDYRGLNKLTTKNRYPLSLITELLDRLGKAKYFTKFDMRDSYYLLRMAAGRSGRQRSVPVMTCSNTKSCHPAFAMPLGHFSTLSMIRSESISMTFLLHISMIS